MKYHTPLAAVVGFLCVVSPARASDEGVADHGLAHVRALPSSIAEFALNPMPAGGGFGQWLGVGAASDAAYRGMTLSGGHDTVQGTYTAAYSVPQSDLAAGVWVPVQFHHGELHRPSFIFWTADTRKTWLGDLTLVGVYIDLPGKEDQISVEFGYAGKRKLAPWLNVNYSAAFAPAALSTYGDAPYVQAGFEVPAQSALGSFGLRGHIGRQWFADNVKFGAPDYYESQIDLFTSWHGIDATLSGMASDVPHKDCFDGSHDCRPRLLLTLSRAVKL
jgi:hypothetical protein